MKYILINDLNGIFKRNSKLLLFSIMIFVFYVFYINKIINIENGVLYYIGLLFDIKYLALISLFIFNYVLYIYIILSIYINNLRLGYDFLFTRMNFKCWNFYKVMSLTLIIFIFKFIQIFIYLIMNNEILSFFELIEIFTNIFLTINIALGILLIYVFRTKYFTLYSIFSILLMLIFALIMTKVFKWQIILFTILIFLINAKIFTIQRVSSIKIKIGG